MEEWLALCEYEKSGRRVQLTERNDSLLFQAGAGAAVEKVDTGR